MRTILITGGTGLIGKALSCLLLEKGYRVIVLSRNKALTAAAASPGHDQAGPFIPSVSPAPGPEGTALSFAHWDPARQSIDAEAVAAADCIIHLAGAGVADKRWS